MTTLAIKCNERTRTGSGTLVASLFGCNFILGIKFRSHNEPFKTEMQRFTTKIVDMMKQENLYSSHGGPIILSQCHTDQLKALHLSLPVFFECGDTFQNYYMYQGGTNFGRTSEGPFISTSYDYDAPIDDSTRTIQHPKLVQCFYEAWKVDRGAGSRAWD